MEDLYNKVKTINEKLAKLGLVAQNEYNKPNSTLILLPTGNKKDNNIQYFDRDEFAGAEFVKEHMITKSIEFEYLLKKCDPEPNGYHPFIALEILCNDSNEFFFQFWYDATPIYTGDGMTYIPDYRTLTELFINDDFYKIIETDIEENYIEEDDNDDGILVGYYHS